MPRPMAVIMAPALLFFLLLFSSACSRSPAGFEAEFEKAEALLGAGKPDQALYAYRSLARAHRGDSRWGVVMLRIAELYSTVLGDGQSAAATLDDLIEISPLAEAGRLGRLARARLRIERHDYQGAIEDYTALIKHFPEGEEASLYRVLLAGVYLTAQDYRQARLEIKALIEGKETPDSIMQKAIFVAAESFFLDGDVNKASGYYRWLLREFSDSPQAPEAKLRLATCIEEMGYLGAAREVTKEAAKTYPNKGVIDARIKSLNERGSKPADQMRREAGLKNVYKEGGLN